MQYKEGDLGASAETLERAVTQWRALGDAYGLAEALRFSGMTALFRANLEKANVDIEEALSLFRAAHDLRGEAWALQNLAWLAFIQGEYPIAEARLETSAATFGEIGDWGGVSWALGLLAWVRFVQGRMEEARDLAVRMEQEARELGNRWAGAMMNVLLANVCVWSGELAAAREQAQSALDVFQHLSDPWGELQAMSPLILSYALAADHAKALALIDEIETLGYEVIDESMSRFPGMVRVGLAVMTGDERVLELAERLLGDLDGQRFINDEQRMLLGLAHLQHGDVDRALELLSNARAMAFGAGSDVAIDVAYAMALVAAGRAQEALDLTEVSEPSLVTYLDRFRHALARAFAHARLGDTAASERALADATTIVDPTDAILDRALARLAAATLWGSSTRAEAAAAEAFDLLERSDVRPVGWERLYALMAGAPRGLTAGADRVEHLDHREPVGERGGISGDHALGHRVPHDLRPAPHGHEVRDPPPPRAHATRPACRRRAGASPAGRPPPRSRRPSRRAPGGAPRSQWPRTSRRRRRCPPVAVRSVAVKPSSASTARSVPSVPGRSETIGVQRRGRNPEVAEPPAQRVDGVRPPGAQPAAAGGALEQPAVRPQRNPRSPAHVGPRHVLDDAQRAGASRSATWRRAGCHRNSRLTKPVTPAAAAACTIAARRHRRARTACRTGRRARPPRRARCRSGGGTAARAPDTRSTSVRAHSAATASGVTRRHDVDHCAPGRRREHRRHHPRAEAGPDHADPHDGHSANVASGSGSSTPTPRWNRCRKKCPSGPIPNANTAVPTPTVPPSAAPNASAVSSSSIRTIHTG